MIPIFRTNGTIGKGILTAGESKEAKKQNTILETEPVSVIGIAKYHNINPLVVCDTSFFSFPVLYKEANAADKQLIFGIEFDIVENASDQSEDSLTTKSKIQVYMKNSEGYRDLINLYSLAHADEKRFYYSGRLQWDDLKSKLINFDNLNIVIPFYDSFLHCNLCNSFSRCVPDFGDIKDIYFSIEDLHDLPFDDLIHKSITDYTKNNNFQTLNTHTIYYYKEADIDAYINFRAIKNRTSFDKPNLSHCCSNKFAFETFETYESRKNRD